MVHFNITLPSAPRTSEWFFSFILSPTKPCIYYYLLPCVSHSPTTSFSLISSSYLCFQEVQRMKGLKWKFRSSGILCRVIWWGTSLCRISQTANTAFLIGPDVSSAFSFRTCLVYDFSKTSLRQYKNRQQCDHYLFLLQLNAHNLLNTYISHQLPPTCFGVVTPSSGRPMRYFLKNWMLYAMSPRWKSI